MKRASCKTSIKEPNKSKVGSFCFLPRWLPAFARLEQKRISGCTDGDWSVCRMVSCKEHQSKGPCTCRMPSRHVETMDRRLDSCCSCNMTLVELCWMTLELYTIHYTSNHTAWHTDPFAHPSHILGFLRDSSSYLSCKRWFMLNCGSLQPGGWNMLVPDFQIFLRGINKHQQQNLSEWPLHGVRLPQDHLLLRLTTGFPSRIEERSSWYVDSCVHISQSNRSQTLRTSNEYIFRIL